MTELEKFQELKQKVLLKYQEQYPYFQGNWKTFSSQDIQNLIGLIEEKDKQTISEKWIYTHLKPETNSKIPRKDMLNILSKFVGFSGWDEFIFEDKPPTDSIQGVAKSKKRYRKFLIMFILILIFTIGYFKFYKKEMPTTKTIQFNNEFTNEKVTSDEVKVVQIKDSIVKPIEVKEGEVTIDNSQNKASELVIKSPFYKTKRINLNQNESSESNKINLKPDDYAMMLKAFMVSDIKDWQTRKEQLNKILSDDLEVMVMLKDNLGAEYFNKNEFIQKLIIPTTSIKKMKVIEIEKDTNQKIKFIRITQE